jgi:hypothetical protein
LKAHVLSEMVQLPVKGTIAQFIYFALAGVDFHERCISAPI